MTNPKLLKLGSPEEVETVYYEAFQHCDLDVMAALWGTGELSCIHPGSGVIAGREAIMRSWSSIFDGAQFPQLEYTVLNRIHTDDLAIHLVAEHIGSGTNVAQVLATNTYQRFQQGWLIVAHHASLVRTEHQGHSLQ